MSEVTTMNSIDDVINFFLSRAAMSPKKLQKLLYYAYSWTLALLNEGTDGIKNRLFDEPIEAWVHGPVVRSVYLRFKANGWEDIPIVEGFNENVFSSEVLDVLNQVWDEYKEFTGDELETMTHREAPWIDARKGIPIYESCSNRLSDEVIFKFFSEMAA